jgi:uncharacterized protein (TIRG00374 family)
VQAGSDLFSKKLGSRMITAILIGGGVYVVMFLYAGDSNNVWDTMASVPASALLAGTALSLASYGVRWVRWQYYLKISGIRAPVGESILIFLAGFVMSVTPAKMGEILKALLLKESRNVPIAKSAPIVVAERFTDLVAMLLLSAVGAFALEQKWAAVVMAMAVVGAFLLGSQRRLSLWVVHLICKVPFLRRFEQKLEAACLSLAAMSSLRPFSIATALSTLGWGIQCLCVWVVAQSFEDSGVTLLIALLAHTAPLLLGTLTLIPGGLGMTEASMTSVLMKLGGPGMTSTASVAVTILVRVITFWLAVALGLAAIVAWRARRRGT